MYIIINKTAKDYLLFASIFYSVRSFVEMGKYLLNSQECSSCYRSDFARINWKLSLVTSDQRVEGAIILHQSSFVTQQFH